jgi:pimeloyl-ACP methyl ester carboxylesterase
MSLLLSAGDKTPPDYESNGSVPAPVPEPGVLDPAQRARGIIAVMEAMGRGETSLFGNGGGAMIALECAASHPQYLDRVVIREPPISSFLPDATELLDLFFSLYAVYKTQGHIAATTALQAEMMPAYAEERPLAEAREEDMENFWKYEFVIFALYSPDLGRVVENGIDVVVGVGEGSGETFLKKVGKPLARRLGCEIVEFPGHHAGFENYAESFARKLVEVLKGMEAKGQELRRAWRVWELGN